MGYGLDKILKVQVLDENGNVVAEYDGNEGLPTFCETYDEETD